MRSGEKFWVALRRPENEKLGRVASKLAVSVRESEGGRVGVVLGVCLTLLVLEFLHK